MAFTEEDIDANSVSTEFLLSLLAGIVDTI